MIEELFGRSFQVAVIVASALTAGASKKKHTVIHQKGDEKLLLVTGVMERGSPSYPL
jgi:hypothetical protein